MMSKKSDGKAFHACKLSQAGHDTNMMLEVVSPAMKDSAEVLKWLKDNADPGQYTICTIGKTVDLEVVRVAKATVVK